MICCNFASKIKLSTKYKNGVILQVAGGISRERKVAKTAGTLPKTTNDAQLRRFLLNNLQKVIEHFQKMYGHQTTGAGQESSVAIETRYEAVIRELERITREYGAIVFTSDLDINPVRGDDTETTTYKEQYSDLLREKKILQQQLRIGLLKQLLQQQLKVEEAQEAISWSTNPAYICATRYDNDDGEQENSNELTLKRRQEVLNSLCESALSDEEIRAYVAMCIVEKTKTLSVKNSYNHT